MLRRFLILLIFGTLALAVGADSAFAADPGSGKSATPTRAEFTEAYAQLLNDFAYRRTGAVETTGFEYSRAAASEGITDRLQRIEGLLARMQAPESGDAALAFWINVYNFTAIRTMIQNWPTKSILKLHFVPHAVWYRTKIDVGGVLMSLHTIEHDVVLKRGPASAHFGLNCASMSCPNLPLDPLYAATVRNELDRLGSIFVRDPLKGIQANDTQCTVSKIFDWYKDDFGPVDQYLNDTFADNRCIGKKIKYLNYDWSPNGK